jgi:uncharacterized protein YoxC
METWQLGLVIVVAILAGSLMPLIFMLTLTVNNLRKQLVTTGRRLDDTLDEIKKGVEEIRLTVVDVHESTARLKSFSQGLEGGEQKIQAAIKAVGDLGHTVQDINDSAKNYSRIIAMAGPFISNFIAALRQNTQEAGDTQGVAGMAQEKTEEKP